MIEIEKRVEFQPDVDLLLKITSRYTKQDIELIITDDVDIKQINKKYRGIDKATDVLSFPYVKMKHTPLGSIVISLDKVQAKAKELGHSESEEFTLLFIHGLLHLLGFDHEVDSGEMRKEEEKLICLFGLPKSLIVRSDEG
ncbi:Metal-dependent hydrolase YbeY, involved in rRNA and/or ribosome maturation and assembly [hydrothermal vent metagenome]|uniref:Metal-dependent hydrolase YbeY, involved in rRNA and/or ribosome maturation and assembly n=1 Tax=hydrothermal vent metagenome TaxID=652676 RepID=A0A1W1BGH5_9ZZZZ